MALEVSVQQVKTRLSRLIERAMTGEDVFVMRSGRRLVRLTPVESAPVPRKLGTGKGDFVVPDDFDDPLLGEILAEFER